VCVEKHNHRCNQHALGSSVGQFFEVLKNRQFGSLIFQNQRMASSSSLKNIQNQRIVHSTYLKKPQRMDGLHERIGKELMILWPVLSLLKQFENHYYTPKPFIWKFWELAGKWIYTWDDNRWASVPHPKNCPTLVGTPCCFKVWQVANLQSQ